MSAKKNSLSQVKSNSPRPGSGWFSGGMGTVILCVVLIGIFIACAYAAWQKIGSRILASPEYFVGPRQIEITPPPPWISRTDLRTEIYRDLSRQGSLSIMDDDLIDRVTSALLRQPWVAKVRHVSKHYPAKINVDLIYRRPVCMVELSGGLMPVDAEATLLPTDDFSPIEAAKYPRLVGVDRKPMGNVGGRWGDSRVAGGAEIAAAILPLWEKLHLQRIIAVSPPEIGANGSVPPVNGRRMGEYQFEIISRGGLRILWGPSPAFNTPGEPTPEQKVKKLEQFFDEHGSLDYPQGPRELDLRH